MLYAHSIIRPIEDGDTATGENQAPVRFGEDESRNVIVPTVCPPSQSTTESNSMNTFRRRTVARKKKWYPRTSWFAVGIVMLATLLVNFPAVSQTVDQFLRPLDPVRSWNQLALETVRIKNQSDAKAARLYAMLNVAMYDAVN